MICQRDPKPRGNGSRPVNPAQEKLSSSRITPRRSLTSLSLARQNTQTGVFSPVLKENMQKYLLLRCIHFSSLQRVDRAARISTASGTECPAIPHSLGRKKKGFQFLAFNEKTRWVTFSLPRWRCSPRYLN